MSSLGQETSIAHSHPTHRAARTSIIAADADICVTALRLGRRR
jgi:hypothetical protein